MITPDEIKKYRLHLELTRKELAEAFGVDENTVYRWESGDVKPNAPGMLLLAFQMLEIAGLENNKKFTKMVKDVERKIEQLRAKRGKIGRPKNS